MTRLNEENFSGKPLGHLELIADKIDELDLINLIDARLPLSAISGSKVTMGERVAAMIINGPGFVDTRLYMLPEFLKSKPTNRLLSSQLFIILLSINISPIFSIRI